jgi:hypothetical protein
MVDKIHSIIREDLLTHQRDLLNMQHYYTHKYRSRDRLLDINVGIFYNEIGDPIVQIYVADKHTRIREMLMMKNNKVIDTNTIIKRYA